MEHRDGHVVILGGSMTGLAVAAALTDRARRVTIVERDRLPAVGQDRRGVPQGRHGHALLPAGLMGLEALLPGLTDDLRAAGAELCDRPEDLRFHAYGGMLQQVDTGHEIAAATRALLEGVVRERVRDLDGVHILDDRDVTGLVPTATGDAVAGVAVRDRSADGPPTTLAADLVVDATGRGSRTPRWLADLGFDPPTTERVRVDVHYRTRLFRRDRPGPGGARQVLVTSEPGLPRAGFAQAVEGDRWLVTLVGVLGTRPPADLDGFRAFAGTLAAPDIHAIVADAEPAGQAVHATYPASVRHRYDRLRRFPGRFVVVGDAVCSFNPTYGQGMSVAVSEASVLRDLLDGGLDRIGPRFFRRSRGLVDVPWDQSVGADLRHPQVEGPRTVRWRLLTPYLTSVFRAAHHDATVARTLLEVMGLIERPEALLRPALVARVVRSLRTARRLPAHPAGRRAAGSSATA